MTRAQWRKHRCLSRASRRMRTVPVRQPRSAGDLQLAFNILVIKTRIRKVLQPLSLVDRVQVLGEVALQNGFTLEEIAEALGVRRP